MATFRFMGHNPTPEETQNAFEQLAESMANGSPLPGRLGLVQVLVECWTTERHGPVPLHVARLGMRTAGILQTWRRSQNPTAQKARPNPVRDFLKAKGATVPAGLQQLAQFAHAYLKGTGEQFTVGDSDEGLVRCNLHGIDVYFTLWRYGGETEAEQVQLGPFVAEDDHDRFNELLAAQIWKTEGSQDLQLSMSERRDQWGNVDRGFELTGIGEPDDYISDGAAELWQNLATLAERVQRFQAVGVSRRLMFFGPPGTGKTTLSRKLARTLGAARTLRIEADAIEHTGTGQVLDFLRLLRPTVLLIDDLDRCGMNAQALLHYLERAHEARDRRGVQWADSLVILATVNAVDQVDPALLREGRFDEVLQVDEPGGPHREAIIAHYLDRFDAWPINEKRDTCLSRLAERMDGFSPASIREVIQSVSVVGWQDSVSEISRVRFQRSLYSGDAVSRFLDRRRALTANGADVRAVTK